MKTAWVEARRYRAGSKEPVVWDCFRELPFASLFKSSTAIGGILGGLCLGRQGEASVYYLRLRIQDLGV